MDAFVVAVVTVSSSVAEFVEVNALFCADALYVVEGTSDHNVLTTWNREEQQQKYISILTEIHELLTELCVKKLQPSRWQ